MGGPIDPTAPLTPEGPGAPVPGAAPGPRRSRRSIVWIVIATLVVGGVVGAGAALLLSGGDDGSEVGVATSTSVATTASTVSTAPTTKPPTASRATSPSQTAAPTTTTTEPPPQILEPVEAAPPVITKFEATPDITCAPGQGVTVDFVWATENADEVMIEDHAEGTTYSLAQNGGAHGVSFTCVPGVTALTRVYTLTATGPGGTTSQSVTVHLTIT